MQVPETDTTVVDVVFDATGTSLPADHAWPLLRAVEAHLPWLPREALAGIHPLRTAPTAYGVVLLAQRAKLVLRVPAERVRATLVLQHATLAVGDDTVHVGAGATRALRPSATLSAQRVATAAVGAAAFEEDVADTLRRMGIAARCISGRRRDGDAGGRKIAGYALALHGLGPADSLRVQGEGIGGDRRLGWGVFVPSKAIVAAED